MGRKKQEEEREVKEFGKQIQQQIYRDLRKIYTDKVIELLQNPVH
ncbi:MAG: hypothetical protein ACUVR0_08475 [Candidatus Aminicenantales bacterium]